MFVQMLLGSIHDLIQAGWIWAILVPLELLLPKSGQISGSARLKNLTLGVLSWSAAGASGAVTVALLDLVGVKPLFALRLAPTSEAARIAYLIGGSLFAALVFDFLYYWFHRIQHTPLLWRFHTVHHAIEDLSATNYSHWTEELSRWPFIVLPTALFQPAGLPVWPTTFALVALQSQLIHTQSRFHVGPFWRVLYDNRFHRIHHSREPRHFDKNFGVITPLWDWMFGTLYVPAKGEWPQTGLLDQPEIDGFADYLARPFKKRALRAAPSPT